MEELRISAKTLDEAITQACVELGVTSDRLDYKIITHGSNGFLGFGAKPFVISAAVKKAEDHEAVKSQNKSNNDERNASRLSAVKDIDHVIDAEAITDRSNRTAVNSKAVQASSIKDIDKAEEERSVTKNDRPKSEDINKNETLEGADIPVRKDSSDRNFSGERRQRTDRFEKSDRSDRSDRQPKAAKYQKEPKDNREPREKREIKPLVLTEDPVERAKSFLESLFATMEMNINYSGEYNNEINELTVNLSGDDMGVLIGKRGQTLDALQYLTSQVVNKHQNGYIRVKLDTENYRERRKETLETFAVNMAHKVRRNKRPMVLEPMNAYERRIIHSVLQSEKDVITRSEGEEPYRHVVICPVRKKTR